VTKRISPFVRSSAEPDHGNFMAGSLAWAMSGARHALARAGSRMAGMTRTSSLAVAGACRNEKNQSADYRGVREMAIPIYVRIA
jgi:hypothetical protein